MEKSKQLMQKAGIYPDLKLLVKVEGQAPRATGPHKVKVLEEKVVMGKDYTSGKEREEMRYTLEEDGEKKIYQVPLKDKNGDLHYLIQRFAEIEEGEEIVLEAKYKGGRNFINVIRLNQGGTEQITDEEIPVIEEEMEDSQQF